MDEQMDSLLHVSDPGLFREALAYTEAKTGFSAAMIEKDYYCSLVLMNLFRGETPLVFKGGTCLSKLYTGFFRLSEDLDFMIPVKETTTRSQRRTEAKPIKRSFESLPKYVPGIDISEELIGHNENRQYIGYLSYPSAVVEKEESLKIEIGLREALLTPSESADARTLVQNPFIVDRSIVPAYRVNAMSLKEAYAEKVRAALTRREPAIRDLFDLSSHVMDSIELNLLEAEFLSLVKVKLKVRGNDPVDVSPERKRIQVQQCESHLKPVLRKKDYLEFDLDDAFERVVQVASSLA